MMTESIRIRRRKRKIAIFVLSGGILAALVWMVDQYFSLEQLVNQEMLVRDAIRQNPWGSFFIGFGVYLVLSLVPGTGGKAVVWGWLFGFWQAVIVVTVGLTIAAMLVFTTSRYLFQASIERRYANFVNLMNKHLEKEGAFYLLTLRMAHAPYSIVNPVSGASRVRTWTFFWTTAVGLLPANIIWIYVGMRLPSLQEFAAQGPAAMVDLPLLVALVGCAFLPLLVRWLVSRFGIPTGETVHDATIHERQRPPT